MNLNIKEKSNNKNFLTGMKKIFAFISPVATYLILFNISFAATAGSGSCSISGMTTLKDIVIKFVVGCILARLVYLIIAVAVFVFLFGIFKFIRSEGDDKQAGRELMFWGIVGIFVMISVWGLVAILQGTFNLSGNYDITPRQVNIPGF